MKKVTQILIIAFIGVVTVNTAKAQTYDPLAVQVINNLIANNGLQATPDAPETWEFATWDDETPKQIIELHLHRQSLTGKASFEGLATLQLLQCSAEHKKTQMLFYENITDLQYLLYGDNRLEGVNVSNCTQLHTLQCALNMTIKELDVTNCTQLQTLVCGGNSLTQLDLTDCTNLKNLDCYYNFGELTKLDLTRCTQLESLNCSANSLTELDLTELNSLTQFDGSSQKVSLTLVKNEAEEYTRTITLNNPTFGNGAISYSDGILKSTDNTVTSTSFTVQTNKPGFELSGTMNFTYSTVGINTPDMEQLKVYPNPTTGELTITNYELRITNVEVFDVYGRKQLSTFNSQLSTQIDISNMKSGIYFVKIITDTGVIVKKVVKQ